MPRIDYILALIALILSSEAFLVLTQPTDRRRRMLPLIGAGLGIVLAWEASLAGLPVAVSYLLLIGAGACHVIDARWRW